MERNEAADNQRRTAVQGPRAAGRALLAATALLMVVGGLCTLAATGSAPDPRRALPTHTILADLGWDSAGRTVRAADLGWVAPHTAGKGADLGWD